MRFMTNSTVQPKPSRNFRLLFLVLIIGLFLVPPVLAAEPVILELKDGSILRGESDSIPGDGPVQIRTEFGDLTVPREKIKTVFTASPATEAAVAPPVPEEPPAAPVAEAPVETPDVSASSSGRIRSEEPPMPEKNPEELLKMDDDDLLKLLEKSDIPPVRPAPVEAVPGGREAVDVLYGLEEETPGKLPEGLDEVKIPTEPPAELQAVGDEIDSMLSAPTGEVETAAGNDPGGDNTPADDAGMEPDSGDTIEVYVPEKGTIDRKIYQKIEKHGGLPVKEEQFRKLKRDEIEKLLQKHKPAEPDGE